MLMTKSRPDGRGEALDDVTSPKRIEKGVEE
jgi:hypothetical protein